jgi:hypothetical protein
MIAHRKSRSSIASASRHSVWVFIDRGWRYPIGFEIIEVA